MTTSPTRASRWLGPALLAGAAYFLIGRFFPQPGDHLRAWRLAAWIASVAVFVAHFAYEHFSLRSVSLSAARHVSAGVAIGAFGLAFTGMLRSLATTGAIRPLWIISLLAWPAITGLPAFIVAWLGAGVLRRLNGKRAE